MDRRYYHGIGSSCRINPHRFSNLFHSHFIIRRFQHLFRCVQAPIKQLKIPFATVSSLFLFNLFNYSAKAETLSGIEKFIENGKIENGAFTKEAMKERGLDFTGLWGKMDEITDVIITIIHDFSQLVYNFTLDLLVWIYEFITKFVLVTPLFLFDNGFIRGATVSFSLISISLIIGGVIYESFRKMARQSHMSFKKILKNIPIAFTIAGFSPFFFQVGFSFINQLSNGIVNLGGETFDPKNFASAFDLGLMDIFIMIIFDIMLIITLIKIIFQNAKRWWDLFCLTATAPLALSAWVFDRHRHIYKTWINHIKKLGVVQLVYATFIMLMVGFVSISRFIEPKFWAIKMIILIGALIRLADPPKIVKNYTRDIGDLDGMLNKGKNTFEKVKDTVMFKNFTPLKYYRFQKSEKARIQELRQKHGKRYIKNLR